MKAQATFTPDWKWGTPEGSREFDRWHDRKLTFLEKIQWLEEAEDLTIAMRASREKQKANLATDEDPQK